MKRIIDLKAVHWSSLKNVLIRPIIKSRKNHIISFGTYFVLSQLEPWLRIITPAGNMQTNKIEELLMKVGQLWIASIDKKTIKMVDMQKILKAQLFQLVSFSPEVSGLEFDSIRIYRAAKAWERIKRPYCQHFSQFFALAVFAYHRR